MDIILYYIRDNLVGTHYFIYAFILFFFMFSIIGYLFKQRFAKYDIKLASSQDNAKKEKNIKTVNKETTSNQLESNKNINTISNTTQITKSENILTSTPVLNNTQTMVKESLASNQENTIPKPMPNPSTNDQQIPKPMPNVENQNINPTPIESQANQTLTESIPEI